MSKQYWIVNLRVLATISVVVLHAAAGVDRFGKIPADWWWCNNVLNAFGRFAVPVFVMISGHLLLEKYDGDLFGFLRKRLSKVFIPFLIWTIIYIIYGSYWTNKIPGFKEILVFLLRGGGGSSSHLWFVYMIIGLYAFTPVLSRWLAKADIKEKTWFIILWFAGSSIYPMITRFSGIHVAFDLHNFAGYTGYFVLGNLLGKIDYPENALKQSLAGMLAGFAITIFGMYYLSDYSKRYDSYCYEYFSPNIILFAVSMFIFFKIRLNEAFLPSILSKLDASSYGIYLSHILCLRILSRNFQINYTFLPPVSGILLQSLLVIIICFPVIYIISILPKGKWITG